MMVRPSTAPVAGSKAHRRGLFAEQHARREEKVREKMRDDTKEQLANMEREFQRLWGDIERTEATLVADVGEMLDLRKQDAKRKQGVLHREWHEKVFEPIQHSITKSIARRAASSDLGQRWRTAQDEYLVAEKKKEAGLFLDIIIPEEYDPRICREQDIRYRVKVDDPIKLEVLKKEREAAMVPGATKAEGMPVGRDGPERCLNPLMWDKLEATPYGRFDKMMAAGNQPPNEAKEKLRRSSVPFDQFDFPRTRAAIDEEFPRPKRTVPGVRR